LFGALAGSCFGGRIVVFLTIRMFIGQISAGRKSRNRPAIRSSSPTKVLKVTVVGGATKWAAKQEYLFVVS